MTLMFAIAMEKNSYAGFWLRFAALLVDLFFFAILGYALHVSITFLFPGFSDAFFGDIMRFLSWKMVSQRVIANFAVLVLFWLLFGWLYSAILESSRLQATLGKIALSLKVGDEKNRRISFMQATKKYCGKLLSVLTFGVLFLSVLLNRKKQGLHDKIAGSFVLKTKNCSYVATACLLTLFFWVPLLNFAFLSGAILLSFYQLILIKRDPKTYGGLVCSILCLIFAIYSLVVGIRIFILYQTGQLV